MKPLKLNGKPFDPIKPAPIIQKAVACCKALPPDELLNTKEFCRRMGYSATGGHWTWMTSDPAMKPYFLCHRRKNYFGSVAAIEELKRRIHEAG